MTLRERWEAINKSAAANVVAKAFLVGFGGNAAYMIMSAGLATVGLGFDLGAFLPHLVDRVWLYLFFEESFKMGTAAAWGYLGTNGFVNGNGLTALFDTFRPGNMNKLKLLVVAMCALAFAGVQTGCADSAPAGGAGVGTNPSAVPAATSVSDLTQFAETAQNVVQTVNTGLQVLAPMVDKAAAVAGLVATNPQEQAILAKIEKVSSAVSADGVAAGLPTPVVQAQVSAVNTPVAAAAIVQQVLAAPPASSGFIWHPSRLVASSNG